MCHCVIHNMISDIEYVSVLVCLCDDVRITDGKDLAPEDRQTQLELRESSLNLD